MALSTLGSVELKGTCSNLKEIFVLNIVKLVMKREAAQHSWLCPSRGCIQRQGEDMFIALCH